MSILVIAQRSGSGWHRMSWEALAAGQTLAKQLETDVDAAAVGDATELGAFALRRVYAVQSEQLSAYTADGFSAALEQLIEKVKPMLVLLPHTYQTRDFAPKLATRFHRSLVSDVIRCKVEGDSLIAVRQLFQGKLNADYAVPGDGPQFVSLQAGAYRAEDRVAGSAPVEIFTPTDLSIRAKVEEPFRESARAVDLTSANIIVSVGRGIKERENIALVEALAQALGGEIAASRPICDNGWLPMERQVGSSGQTVAPKIYFAIGISGAIQHLVGMKGAKTIVAINKDPEAPIFEIADYGIAGDLFEVVPALTAAVNQAKSQ